MRKERGLPRRGCVTPSILIPITTIASSGGSMGLLLLKSAFNACLNNRRAANQFPDTQVPVALGGDFPGLELGYVEEREEDPGLATGCGVEGVSEGRVGEEAAVGVCGGEGRRGFVEGGEEDGVEEEEGGVEVEGLEGRG